MRKPLLGVLALLGVAASIVVAAFLIGNWPPWDPRMPASDVESVLELQVRDGKKYECEREENDGTIEGMKDVDYFCTPRGGERCHPGGPCSESGYWVGTDSKHITEIRAFF
jgi:hypothetical protein